jgi:flagellar biogenesis protein FliO
MPARSKSFPALAAVVLGACAAAAAETNTLLYGAAPAPPAVSPGMDVGESLARVFGALAIVMALFFGAVWFYRNWQGALARKHGGVRLDLMEVRSLGNKQSLVVVGYGPQRLLVGASPAGIHLLTHLPSDESAPAAEPVVPETVPSKPPRFMEALQQVLNQRRGP